MLHSLLSDDQATPGPIDPTIRCEAADGRCHEAGVDLNGGELRPGDRVEYTIEFTNTGNALARNVRVVIQFPPIAYCRCCGCATDTDTLTWTIGDVAPAELPKSPIQPKCSLHSQMGRTSPIRPASMRKALSAFLTDNPSTPTADDPTVLVVTSAPILTVKKWLRRLDGSVFRAGRRVRYTIVVEKYGRCCREHHTDRPAAGCTARADWTAHADARWACRALVYRPLYPAVHGPLR